ncbi:MAG: prolipoprotein diacylglyceryl transferase family protein [Desulfopila sp.]
MVELLFCSTAGGLLSLLLVWGFRNLPGERWQMLAVIPGKKQDEHSWQGTNLTYYGFFIATSQLLSLALLFILLGAMEISLAGAILATTLVLAVSVPAARIIAILVERKRHTFTIGGAGFVGMIAAPLAIIAASEILGGFFPCYLPLIPVMAAMAIAYTLGEGLGRLACLSYGCCYGKPLKMCSRPIQQLFATSATVFSGFTKKAEYEGQLCGEPLVPVQAITSILFSLTCLLGTWLFLHGDFTIALVLCITVTQLWRLVSEFLRADFRGCGTISVYQKMSVVAVLYIIGVTLVPQAAITVHPVVTKGIGQLWQPGVILGLQLAWLLFFVYFGRSTVTRSQISFSLHQERL